MFSKNQKLNQCFQYDVAEDAHSFREGQCRLGLTRPISASVSAATVAGNANSGNEDAWSINIANGIGLFGVFDGTTSLRPIAELQARALTGARFASHHLLDFFQNTEITETADLPGLLLKANASLLAKILKFDGATLADTHSMPSSLATIIRIDSDRNIMETVHVGDSFAIIYYQDGSSRLVTPNTNRDFDESIFRLIKKLAAEHSITNREARRDPEVAQALLKMFQFRNNRPDGKGSGLINGDPQGAQYIFHAKEDLERIEAILVGTDGLMPPGWECGDEDVQREVRNQIEQGGIQALIKTKVRIEDADPNWNSVRYKHSDDATGIFIKLKA